MEEKTVHTAEGHTDDIRICPVFVYTQQLEYSLATLFISVFACPPEPNASKRLNVMHDRNAEQSAGNKAIATTTIKQRPNKKRKIHIEYIHSLDKYLPNIMRYYEFTARFSLSFMHI